MFGGDTLVELRVSLQLAELEREGGFSPHIRFRNFIFFVKSSLFAVHLWRSVIWADFSPQMDFQC